MSNLSEYLLNRGLTLEPLAVDKRFDPILEDPSLVKEAAELWESKQPLIKMVLQARINAIGYEILTKCPPQEVLVLRQALVEIGAIVDDFEKYKGEHGRITTAAESEEEQPPAPVEEGMETSV